MWTQINVLRVDDGTQQSHKCSLYKILNLLFGPFLQHFYTSKCDFANFFLFRVTSHTIWRTLLAILKAQYSFEHIFTLVEFWHLILTHKINNQIVFQTFALYFRFMKSEITQNTIDNSQNSMENLINNGSFIKWQCGTRPSNHTLS